MTFIHHLSSEIGSVLIKNIEKKKKTQYTCWLIALVIYYSTEWQKLKWNDIKSKQKVNYYWIL